VDYFEHFGLACIFNLDLDHLRKQYYIKSRESHPDHLDKDDAVNHLSSAYNNEAFRVLSNPSLRLKYILNLKLGPDLNEPKPNTLFLSEMMDLHEMIDKAVDNNNSKEIISLKETVDQLYLNEKNEIEKYLVQFDHGDNSKDVIQKMMDYYIKLKYFDRLYNNLNNKENEL